MKSDQIIETQSNSSWFTVTVEELEEIIPYPITKRLLDMEVSYYVILTNLLAVIKDIFEESLFPEKDEVEKILKELSQKLKTQHERNSIFSCEWKLLLLQR